MKKHTPGPWFVDKNDKYTVRTDGQDGKTMWIVDLDSDADTSNSEGMLEREYNAHLIAAAPEMLEALDHALADIQHYGGRTLLIEKALRKARGEKMNTVDTSYNGWANYETWNVALWISNDEGFHNMAREHKHESNPYKAFIQALRDLDDPRDYTMHLFCYETPDNVAWNDSSLDIDALNSMIREYL